MLSSLVSGDREPVLSQRFSMRRYALRMVMVKLVDVKMQQATCVCVCVCVCMLSVLLRLARSGHCVLCRFVVFACK